MSPLNRRIVLAVLVAAHLAGGMFIFPLVAMIDSPAVQYFQLMMMGILSAQVSLLAIWLVLGSQGWPAKVPMTLALLVLGCYSLLVGLRLCGNDFYYIAEVLIMGLVALGLFTALQAPLWLIRGLWSWRIVAGVAPQSDAAVRPMQFSVRHLLVWTTVVAVLLALGRLVFPAESWIDYWQASSPDEAASELFEWIKMIAITVFWLTLAVLVLMLPYLWAAFARIGVALIAMGLLGVYLVVISLIETLITGFFSALEPEVVEAFFYFLAFNTSLALTTLVSLWIIRATGLRLIRVQRSRTEQPADTETNALGKPSG